VVKFDLDFFLGASACQAAEIQYHICSKILEYERPSHAAVEPEVLQVTRKPLRWSNTEPIPPYPPFLCPTLKIGDKFSYPYSGSKNAKFQSAEKSYNKVEPRQLVKADPPKDTATIWTLFVIIMLGYLACFLVLFGYIFFGLCRRVARLVGCYEED